MITVLLGPDKHRFYVHENLLVEESSIVAGMVIRPTEGSVKELRLLDMPHEAVEVLVDYLYHSDFASNATWEPTTTLTSFIHAWMLANKLEMEDAKNAVMDRLRFTVDMANTHEIERYIRCDSCARSGCHCAIDGGKATALVSVVHLFDPPSRPRSGQILRIIYRAGVYEP